jgi:hypothetical protein
VVGAGFRRAGRHLLQEDISFKKLVADYKKASGNTLDYAIIP